jgi:hypothetical protein
VLVRFFLSFGSILLFVWIVDVPVLAAVRVRAAAFRILLSVEELREARGLLLRRSARENPPASIARQTRQ